jgi:hypothetical protein
MFDEDSLALRLTVLKCPEEWSDDLLRHNNTCKKVKDYVDNRHAGALKSRSVGKFLDNCAELHLWH